MTCPLLAHLRHAAIAELSLFSGVKRKSDPSLPKAALAAKQTLDKFRDVTEVKVGHQRAATLFTTPVYGSHKD